MDSYKDSFLGSFRISIRDFDHQKKIERWFNLKNQQDKQDPGLIRLRLQLFWSRYTYYQNEILKCESELSEIAEEIQDLNKYLTMIQQPFGIFTRGVSIEDMERNFLDEYPRNQDLYDRKRISVYPYQANMPFERKAFADKIEDAIRMTISKSE